MLAYDRQVPWWTPVAMLVGMLTAPVHPIGMVAGGLLYIDGSGGIGLRMLRMSDDEWADAPADSAKEAVTR